jgi:hypothetical protein
VLAKVRERLAVSKRTMQKFVVEKFSFNKLNELESKEHYQVKSQTVRSIENLK